MLIANFAGSIPLKRENIARTITIVITISIHKLRIRSNGTGMEPSLSMTHNCKDWVIHQIPNSHRRIQIWSKNIQHFDDAILDKISR